MPRDTAHDITVYVLRHGQTELNAAGRMRGRINVALDETGSAQAEALGLLFKGVPLQRVIASWNKLVRQDGRWHALVVDARPDDGHTP